MLCRAEVIRHIDLLRSTEYTSKYPRGKCLSNKVIPYVDLALTIPSRRLTLQQSNKCSISQLLKIQSSPSSIYRKNCTWKYLHIAERKNKSKQQMLEALFVMVSKPALNKIKFEYINHILKYLITLLPPFLSCSKIIFFRKFTSLLFLLLLFVSLFGFYGTSTFKGYFIQNPFFFANNQFYFKLLSLAWVHSLIVQNISLSSDSV